MEQPRKKPGRRPGEHKEFPYQKLVRMRREDVENVERATRAGGFESEAETMRVAVERLHAQLDAVEAAADQLEGSAALAAWRDVKLRLLSHREGAFQPLLAKIIGEERIREAEQTFPRTPDELRDYDWARALAQRLRLLGLPVE